MSVEHRVEIDIIRSARMDQTQAQSPRMQRKSESDPIMTLSGQPKIDRLGAATPQGRPESKYDLTLAGNSRDLFPLMVPGGLPEIS